MTMSKGYLLLTQTAEKRTNGTNVGMQALAFYFSSLGPVKITFYFLIENKSGRKCISAFIFILKTSQDKVKKRTTLHTLHPTPEIQNYFGHFLLFFRPLQKPVITHLVSN
jgi:hypothetical protein